MIYLAFIWHMHQPYYSDLASDEIHLPWVRLHGIKDYVDMVKILENYPKIRQTFNLVPSLIEQIDAYVEGKADKYQALSYKRAGDLTENEKHFLLERFFSVNITNLISVYPRYYQLYLKKQAHKGFSLQDYLDLQVWFNLAWFDPCFKQGLPQLKALVEKGRFYSEDDKRSVLDTQISVLKSTIGVYREFQERDQIEITISPYYHPILPLLCDTDSAKEANPNTNLPHKRFSYPQDAQSQVDQAIKLYQEKFGRPPLGMWPSEQAVSEEIIPIIAGSGIKWIVTDEEILYKSVRNPRSAENLYKPYLLKRKKDKLAIIFRDRNLSDLIGFSYYNKPEKEAADDFISHLKNIETHLKGKEALVIVAMDGENAWEYYKNDGRDFLNKLYEALSNEKFIQTVTISHYLQKHRPCDNIKKLQPGSWIYGNFNKWIGYLQKNKAWEYLSIARKELEEFTVNSGQLTASDIDIKKAWKQIFICEGSDWFWWYGDNNEDFDWLFRRHLSNFYKFIGKPEPDYLQKPI